VRLDNDGSKIAIKVNDPNGYNAEIYVINTAGTVQNQVVSGINGAIGGLNFSINGQRLILQETYLALKMQITGN
jgi:hypothetical protein